MTKKVITLLAFTFFLVSCSENDKPQETKIIFLHHSTGRIIWYGNNQPGLVTRAINKVIKKSTDIGVKAELPLLFSRYNKEKNRDYVIEEQIFPKASPYGWNNYPFDYYNIWVKNSGNKPFMREPTLEILTKDYDVIIFKHCFPVSNIKPDLDTPNIYSDIKTVSNYKLHYLALREKLLEFPNTKFILFTGATQVKANITEESALAANTFFDWVKNEWDLPEDNIYLWDLHALQTEGGLYFKDEFAMSANNSHPNVLFAERVVHLLFNRIIDVIETHGEKTNLNGEMY